MILKKENWTESSPLTIFSRISSIVSIPLIMAVGSSIWWVTSDLIESHVTKPLIAINGRVDVIERKIDDAKDRLDETKTKNTIQDLQIAKDSDNIGTIGIDVKGLGVKIDGIIAALGSISSDVAVLNERTKQSNNKGLTP